MWAQGARPRFSQASDCSFCKSEDPLPAEAGIWDIGDTSAKHLSAFLCLERSPEPKTVPEPARPQREFFCGEQQHPRLPPLKKPIFMKKGWARQTLR